MMLEKNSMLCAAPAAQHNPHLKPLT
jgi:hypothetical protein